MKKLGIIVKEKSENRISNFFRESSAVMIVRYSGLSSPDLSLLRQNLRRSNATLFVVKNSVACRALGNLGLKPLIETVQGPCGMVFVRDEPVAASKVLCGFLKEHGQLKLGGGCLKDKILQVKDIELMSLLPTREVLRAQVVMTLNSPISGIVFTLNQILAKLVYCLNQIRQTKEK